MLFFSGERKAGVPGQKPLGAENHQQTQPTYDLLENLTNKKKRNLQKNGEITVMKPKFTRELQM